MTGPAPAADSLAGLRRTSAEIAIAADHGAAATLGAALITAGRYIQAHPGEPVPASIQDSAHRALDTYADSTRLAVAS